MKFIFDGGYNSTKEESVANNVFVRFDDLLSQELKNGKKVLLVASAKPTNYYKQKVLELVDLGIDIVERDHKGLVDWGIYDYIFVPGGDSVALAESLNSLNFSLERLKSDVVYIGSSAGTMVLAPYYYNERKRDKDGSIIGISFKEGLFPSNNQIYVVHVDNVYFVNEFLLSEVCKFAKKHNLEVVKIKENEVIEKSF